MAKPRRDLFAEWFAALEDLGYSYAFRFGRFRPGMSEPEWFFFSHQEFDGLGALAHTLRTRGEGSIELPQVVGERPSWFALVVALFVLLFRRRPKPVAWKEFDPSKESKVPDPSIPNSFGWTLFSKDETRALRDLSKAKGVSLNAWLLWAFTEVLRPHLREDAEATSAGRVVEWILPVNMRGAVHADRDTANQAFSIEVAFPPTATPAEVHALIQRDLARKVHWIGPMMMRFFTRMKPARLREVVKRAAELPKIGCFSNMGALAPIPGSGLGGEGFADVEEWWMASNPVFAARPVGVVALTWRGRLSVTLQLHATLAKLTGDAPVWLAKFRAIALAAPAAGGADISPTAFSGSMLMKNAE